MANFLNENNDYNYFGPGIKLKTEQIEMINFGLTKYNCILNGKVGVGKTICGLAIAKTILDKTSNVACFVLCPKAANTAFFKEFKRMNTSVSVVITEQKSIVKGSKYFLFNQSNVLDMVTWLYALKERGYRVILLCDEVHFMQSADSNVSDTVRKVRSQFTCVIGMTGTPLLQELEGLFRVVDFVRPGYLGTFTDFTNRYINYREKTIYLKGNRRRKVKEVMSYKNLPELRERLKGIIIVRGRDYDIQYHYYTTKLSDSEQDLYEEASKGIINEGETERQESARLHDLQRVVDGSHKKSDKNILSSKQQLLVNTCREIVQRGEGTLIYTEYEDTYTTLGRVLKKYRSYIGFDKLYYITGKTSTEDRYQCEKNLKEKDIAIVTRAGCQSINLQGVNNVVIYNTSFSIGWIIQMIGRITRTDTKYPKLHVYFLEVSETIDTYKRLLFQDHALLIKEVLGKEPILPDFTEVNKDLMKKYRSYFKRKLLWCK